MKKSIGLISAVMLSTIMFTGCESMSANGQRIGAAALGGAVGGGVGNKVGGAEFAQGAQNLFFDCLRILGFRERF